MTSPEICIVLVEPRGERNIGAVARAMRNFGESDLRLVRPQADHLSEEARHTAVRARGVLEEARLFDDLADALADRHMVFGTTRRFGKYREDVLTPPEAAVLVGGQAAAARIAVVFGREDHGLSTAELDLCTRLLSIPTSATLGSMNLSHAVAICLYAMFSLMPKGGSAKAGKSTPASCGAMEAMFLHMGRSLLDIGFLNPQNPDHILRTFRRLFGRAVLSKREVDILHGLWSRVDWLLGELRKEKSRK